MNAGDDSPRSIADLISTVSASRLTTFQQCRLKFYFRYVLGLQRPKTSALHVGGAVHETLKYWNKARWRNESATLKQLHDAYLGAWGEAAASNGEVEEQKTGWRLLETYFRESPIKPDEKPEAVEVSVEADLAKHGLPKLVGIIDLVRPPGIIVDFKTSGQTPVPEKVAHQTDTQTSAYGVLYRECTGKKETSIELHHLVKLKNPKLVVTALEPATDLQKTRLFKIIESYVNGLNRSDFIPSPGLQCASCEFFSECRAWS